MKKLLLIVALASLSTLSFGWERRSFETRPFAVGARRVEFVQDRPAPILAETDTVVVDEEPIVAERTYPVVYRGDYDYRPVRGVLGGAATAAEGVVEGTAQAIGSVIP